VELTNEDVADILALLDSLPYDTLDLRTDSFRLTLRRTPGTGWTEESELLARPAEVAPEASRPAGDGAGQTGASAGTGPDAGDADGLVAVVAPLPGTFYRAPRPGAPPFVEIGDVVGPDTVIAIIETMKLMNSVHARTPGRVAQILLQNGEFAPLGAPLLLIEPDSLTPREPDS
jgi:acetyl-CoA carboxylase biotin carboxyl carrier protein